MKALSAALSLGCGFSALAQESATRDALLAKSVQQSWTFYGSILKRVKNHESTAQSPAPSNITVKLNLS